ncbi:MAG: hypothetical protein CL798_09850 [Chromatiales bacterium]|nr:hypothetical protein [Chromatiales bacterium]
MSSHVEAESFGETQCLGTPRGRLSQLAGRECPETGLVLGCRGKRPAEILDVGHQSLAERRKDLVLDENSFVLLARLGDLTQIARRQIHQPPTLAADHIAKAYAHQLAGSEVTNKHHHHGQGHLAMSVGRHPTNHRSQDLPRKREAAGSRSNLPKPGKCTRGPRKIDCRCERRQVVKRSCLGFLRLVRHRTREVEIVEVVA